MLHPRRFHVLIIPTVPWAELLRRARQVEQLGFDAVALPDHLVDWTNPPAPWYDAWTALAAIAQATETIRLTTAVTQIPLRNPARPARLVLTRDQISNGRVELGLGTGLTIDPSYRMAGLPNWSPAERADRFGEYLELVCRLLSQETTTYDGRYYQADGAVMNPRPVQQPRPRVMVAALGPKMMRHAVRHADIWNSLSFQQSFEEQLAETRDRSATIDRLCAELDRDPATLQRSYTMFDPHARHNGGALSYYQSPEAFLAQIEPLLALGITDFGLYYPFLPDQEETFARIATEIMPNQLVPTQEYRAMPEIDHFSNDEEGYVSWLKAHPDGYVLNIDTNGPGKDMLHTTRCPHLYPPTWGYRNTTYAKACSDDVDTLKRWSRSNGHHWTRCSTCEVY
jgi:alkanesulfonate monooxygenase SsuD/methylene tetrahydromethanopterin reductase-like flavin-dependent oxidoreductase (luciferase family)